MSNLVEIMAIKARNAAKREAESQPTIVAKFMVDGALPEVAIDTPQIKRDSDIVAVGYIGQDGNLVELNMGDLKIRNGSISFRTIDTTGKKLRVSYRLTQIEFGKLKYTAKPEPEVPPVYPPPPAPVTP